jgi:hypothetical protein
MRPVSSSRLDSRVRKKSILMLDITRLSVNYIENAAPGNISSKQGSKYLPLEIWLEILDLAVQDDNSHKYRLVQPRSIEHSKAGPTTLICAEVPEWDTCGLLEDPTIVWNYEYYLARPHTCRPDVGDRPFNLPDDKAPVYRIPTAALDKKMLFERLTVADVIAWVDQGECHLCNEARSFCTCCRYGIEVAEEWTSATHLGDCWITMLCPLCIGVGFAEDSISMQQELLRSSNLDMTEDEYEEWVNERFTELGYM